MSKELPVARSPEEASERRQGPDRRKSIFRSLFIGSLTPRRRGQRRGSRASLTDVDWHHPQWLAVAVLILLASAADALLTLTLLAHGAIEANPVMAALLDGGGFSFAAVKIGLTAFGTIFLILLARAKAFRWIPIGFVLYAVLVGYGGLLAYEMWLLDRIAS